MARDILSEYGRDSRQPQAPRNTNGGKPGQRDVMNYAEPQGPKRNYPAAPGLGADNYGCCGTQGKYGVSAASSGRPGLGGENRGIKNRP
jgi:hypothetical protein